MVMIYRPTISGSGAGLIVAYRPLLTVFGRGQSHDLPAHHQQPKRGELVVTHQPTTSGSGAGVGLVVGFAQTVDGDVGVELRGREAGMTQEFLYHPQIGAAFE